MNLYAYGHHSDCGVVGMELEMIVEFGDSSRDVGNYLGAVVEDLDNPSKQLVWIDGYSCISDCSIAIAASHHEA